jgi:hypothetical protein
MPLFVQLTDAQGEPLWHTVESYSAVGFDPKHPASVDFQRSYLAGCGLEAKAGADRMLEAENPPWTNRHVAKGCFKTAADKQKG